MVGHALGHLAFALPLGDLPITVSTLDLQGDWSELDDVETVLAAIGGPVANGLLGLVGWSMTRRVAEGHSLRALTGWAVFAVNGWFLVGYAVISPLAGMGDWMSLVERFPNRTPFRASIVATGGFAGALVWKETVPALARVVGNGRAPTRIALAKSMAGVTWFSAVLAFSIAVLAASAPTLVPAGVVVAVVAVATSPLLMAARPVGELAVREPPLDLPRSWPVRFAAIAFFALVVLWVAPGLPL